MWASASSGKPWDSVKESARLLQDHEPLFTLQPRSFLPSISLPQISPDYILTFHFSLEGEAGFLCNLKVS